MYFDINVWALGQSLPQRVFDMYDLHLLEELLSKLIGKLSTAIKKFAEYFAKPWLQLQNKLVKSMIQCLSNQIKRIFMPF